MLGCILVCMHTFATHLFHLAGKEVGEDFADAFAGALLFPAELARTVYEKVSGGNKMQEMKVLQAFAAEHGISLFSGSMKPIVLRWPTACRR